MIDTLIQITGSTPRGPFCAGVVARDGRVIEVAPILRRHIIKGMTGTGVAAVCREKCWTWEKVHDVHS